MLVVNGEIRPALELLEAVPEACSTVLLAIGITGCEGCRRLKSAIEKLGSEAEFAPDLGVVLLTISEVEDVRLLGLNVSAFPTLLGFRESKLYFGWQGFASLAPVEIGEWIVRDVIEQARSS